MNITEASVLLVDDEPVLLEIYTHVLKSFGCARVFVASNGEEALSLILAEDVDLLITDVRMPVMDGVTLVRRLNEGGKAIPSIVFVSGFSDVNRREMYMLGVEAFLTKPFDPKELLDTAENALADRSALWGNAMVVDPKQFVILGYSSPDEMGNMPPVCLGRGGLSAHTTEPLILGRVGFQCLISGKELKGQGFVRWFSRAEKKVGIEFAYLDPSCRLWLAESLDSSMPRSFIPGY
jgi:CheY-like chemotaxis protein